MERNNIDHTKFANIFWGDSTSLEKFYHEKSVHFETTFLKSSDFMSITGGKMPLILLIEDRKIIERYGYRNIDEAKIVDFLK